MDAGFRLPRPASAATCDEVPWQQGQTATGLRCKATPTLMSLPRADHRITLQKGALTAEALCLEVLEDPGQPGGYLLKVLVREDFEEGEQCWLVDAADERIGATVKQVELHSGDRELTLAAFLPEDAEWAEEG